MTWRLFLDDERDPASSVDLPAWRRKGGLSLYPQEHALSASEWIIARSHDEAVALVEQFGCPGFISFDHDLGDGNGSGMTFADWLVERDLDAPFIPEDFSFEVHSQNPVGRKNIESLLTGYLRFKRENADPENSPNASR